jgi:putative redox protein
MREINVNWNPAGPMLFEAVDKHGNKVTMDGSPEHGGAYDGFSPKVLLLVALGGCTGMDVVSILRKMRQDVRGYHLEIKGIEHEEHPKKFDQITIVHVVEGHNLNKDMVDKAVRLSHEKYCGVSASLAGSVEIKATSRLVEVE